MNRPSFYDLLKKPRPLVTPVAHDALSARMIERAGFEATGVAGSAMMAAQHALPDVGLAGMAEMLEGARTVIRGTSLPWGADGDDGFGDAKNVVHTVRSFERIGCGQLVLEDQSRATKRPGDGGSQTLIAADEMAAKLRAALESRDSSDFMIVGRTDAALLEGVDAALSRAEKYLSAGVDAIFVAGLQTPEQLRRVGEALQGAILVAAVGERRIREWPGPTELYEMGYSQISYPGLLINSVYAAMADALAKVNELSAGSREPGRMTANVDALEAMSDALDQKEWDGLLDRYSRAQG
jgi:2-methylisocitrate lyase-like PEP mutase family enzyme